MAATSAGRSGATTSLEDPRFVDLAARRANSAACVAELDAIFAAHTFAEWKVICWPNSMRRGPLFSRCEDVIEDPQVAANGYVGEVRLDGGASYRLPTVPVQFDEQAPDLRRAPEHGEHTEACCWSSVTTGTASAELTDEGVIP